MCLTTFQPASPREHLLLAMAIGQASSQKVRPHLRIQLSFVDNNPAPTSYQPKSDFDKVDPHGRAFSFGIAREAYEKVYIKENPPLDKNIPGPGSYTIPQKVGAEASKYSMKGRTLNHCNNKSHIISLLYLVMLTTTRHNPGPGAYEPKLSFDP